MEFKEFQEISKIVLSSKQLANCHDLEYCDEKHLLKLLADAKNKPSNEIELIHVLGAMELKGRMERGAVKDCAWEAAEIFRKIYSEYMRLYPYAHLGIKNESNSFGLTSNRKKLYLLSQVLLQFIHAEKKRELDSINNAMAPLCLGEPVYRKEDVLVAAKILKNHLSRGRFSEDNLNRAKKILSFPCPKTEAEEIVCAKAELIAMIEKTDAAWQIESMINKKWNTPLSPSAIRKLKQIMEGCSGEREAGALPHNFGNGRPSPNETRRMLHVHSDALKSGSSNGEKAPRIVLVRKT